MTDSYSSEDVQQILQIALAQKAEGGEFSDQQLLEMAGELGISPDTLERASQQWKQQQQEQEAKKALQTRRRRKFQKHLFSYLSVNTFLIIINLLTDGHLSWAIWPLLGWGLGLSFEAWNTYQTSESMHSFQFTLGDIFRGFK